MTAHGDDLVVLEHRELYDADVDSISGSSVAERTSTFLSENTELDAVLAAAENRAHRSILETSEADGDEAGVNGTPTFFLYSDGHFKNELVGVQDVTAFEAGFDVISLPTTRSDWRMLGRTIRLVLGHPTYLALAVVVMAVAAILMSVSQDLRFVVEVVLSDSFGLSFKLDFLTAMLPFLGPQYDRTHGILIYAIAALTGANVALLAYHLLERDLSVESGDGSAAGVVLGTLGAGCAACGPGILAGLVGIVGGAGVLATLPYEGLEFSMLAVVVLVLSMYWLADGMRDVEIRGCPVDPGETGRG